MGPRLPSRFRFASQTGLFHEENPLHFLKARHIRLGSYSPNRRILLTNNLLVGDGTTVNFKSC